MKVGVFTVHIAVDETGPVLDYLVALGVQAVEIGAGGYAGTDHCPVAELLAKRTEDQTVSSCDHVTRV